MIASVDGATTIGGLSGGLGGPGDRRVFLALRSLADAILVAAGTVRAERYGPAPFIAVVTRTCNLDWESPFFTAATSRPVVVTVSSTPRSNRDRAAEVADIVVAGDTDVDLPLALRALADRGAASVLAEGGPTLNGHLAAAGLIDELCLTLSPRLVGGEARRILAGPPVPGAALRRLHALYEDDGFLFLRYR